MVTVAAVAPGPVGAGVVQGLVAGVRAGGSTGSGRGRVKGGTVSRSSRSDSRPHLLSVAMSSKAKKAQLLVPFHSLVGQMERLINV